MDGCLLRVLQAQRQPQVSPVGDGMGADILHACVSETLSRNTSTSIANPSGSFFAVDLSNRILHELGMNLSSAYLGIDIGIGSFSSIADGLLQGYMIIHSPVDIKTASRLPRLLMILALVLYSLTSISTRGTQLWNVILQIYLSSAGGSDSYSEPSSQIYQDLGTAACGMILLFAIGYALFSIQYIRRLPTTEGKRKRIRWGVGILAAAFLVRNIVVFVFVLIYSQHQHIAALSAQLVYLAFYGLLSVAIYACVVAIARAQQADESSTDRARFSPLKQTDTGERFEPAYYSYPYIPKSG